MSIRTKLIDVRDALREEIKTREEAQTTLVYGKEEVAQFNQFGKRKAGIAGNQNAITKAKIFEQQLSFMIEQY